MDFNFWEILLNPPLMAGVVSMLTVQIFKIFLPLFRGKKIDLRAFANYGGMPSGHTAFITSVTIAIGISAGWRSPLFALAAVFSSIVIYDILKMRRAVEINLNTSRQLAEKKIIEIDKKAPQFKGHSTAEVIFGGLWGVAMAFLVSWIFTLLPVEWII